jgi:two-component system NtrC family sensor kinase
MGRNPRLAAGDPQELDLSFLNWNLPDPYLFFERTRHHLDAVSRVPGRLGAKDHRRPGSDVLPALHRARPTIAYLGVSRTVDGDYLSSVDVELLLTLAGMWESPSRTQSLYRSLQRKVEEYERLKEFSENIVESINVGILAADLDDRVESWNSADRAAERHRASGRGGKHACRSFSRRTCGAVRPRARRNRASTSHLQIRAERRPQMGHGNGQRGHCRRKFREATLNIAIAPLVSKDQEQIGRLMIFDDVTDRAELEQRLVQADKLSSIGLLAAGVAHEVNTPLAVISTYAQMLAKQVADDSQKSLILDKIAKQTFRASEIVNSLLNFSRTSTTFWRCQPQPRDSGNALAAGAPTAESRESR